MAVLVPLSRPPPLRTAESVLVVAQHPPQPLPQLRHHVVMLLRPCIQRGRVVAAAPARARAAAGVPACLAAGLRAACCSCSCGCVPCAMGAARQLLAKRRDDSHGQLPQLRDPRRCAQVACRCAPAAAAALAVAPAALLMGRRRGAQPLHLLRRHQQLGNQKVDWRQRRRGTRQSVHRRSPLQARKQQELGVQGPWQPLPAAWQRGDGAAIAAFAIADGCRGWIVCSAAVAGAAAACQTGRRVSIAPAVRQRCAAAVTAALAAAAEAAATAGAVRLLERNKRRQVCTHGALATCVAQTLQRKHGGLAAAVCRCTASTAKGVMRVCMVAESMRHASGQVERVPACRSAHGPASMDTAWLTCRVPPLPATRTAGWRWQASRRRPPAAATAAARPGGAWGCRGRRGPASAGRTAGPAVAAYARHPPPRLQ